MKASRILMKDGAVFLNRQFEIISGFIMIRNPDDSYISFPVWLVDTIEKGPEECKEK